MSYFCLNCVKGDALKKHIAEYGELRERCIVCAAENTKQIACDVPSFKSKFRALIRYFYSETDYNTHLGGESVELLFFRENPITNYAPNWNTDEYDGALMAIVWRSFSTRKSTLAIGSEGIPAGRTVGVRWFRSGSWRRSYRR